MSLQTQNSISENFICKIRSALRQFAVPSDDITVHITELNNLDDERAKYPRLREKNRR